MKSKIVEKILNEVSLDPRVRDGVFSLEDNSHMDVLREYLIAHGINEGDAREYCNVVVEGKYPERQAYNARGILVTFPTPEYKQRAIQRGTHFEKDPTKGKPNIFAAQQQAPEPGEPPSPPSPPAPGAPAPEPKAPAQPQTSLPLSQAGKVSPPQADVPSKVEPTPAPATVAAPQQAQTPQAPAVSPEDPAPPPPPPSPAEKEANKVAIKKMLKGDDYMLETGQYLRTPPIPRAPYDNESEASAWQDGYSQGFSAGAEWGRLNK